MPFFSILANNDANTFTNTSPIQLYTESLLQTYIGSNTDQYKHQYRPMHTSLFSILATLHVNTGIGTVKSGARASSATPSSTCVSEVSEPPKPYTAAWTTRLGRLHTVPQRCETAKLSMQPCSSAANFSSTDSGECRFIAICLVARISCQCP